MKDKFHINQLSNGRYVVQDHHGLEDIYDLDGHQFEREIDAQEFIKNELLNE